MAHGPLTFKKRDVEAAIKTQPGGGVVYVLGFDHYVKIGFSRDFAGAARSCKRGSLAPWTPT